MIFRYKKSFLKDFDRLPTQQQQLAISADKQIRSFYAEQQASFSLRIKKLFSRADVKVFEARVSDKLRIVWVESPDLVSFAVLGNHEDVKNFIKNCG